MKRLTFLIAALILFSNICFAQQFPQLIPEKDTKGFKKTAPVVVNGDRVEYLQAKKQIIGTGNVKITYGDVTLTCEKITVFTEKKVGICEGNVKITQPLGVFEGESVEYDFVKKTGKIIDGNVASYPFYGHADRIEKESEKKVVFDGGSVTTCDLDEPHYRIQAKQVRLYLDDKVVAEHVLFFIGKIPVFYIPYYIQPIRDIKTKLSLIPGYENNWGYYVLGAYRFYRNELCKGYLRLDYRQNKGLAEGIDYEYNAKELGKGLARAYYAHEGDDLTMNKGTRRDDRWRLEYKHSADLTDDTQLMVELNKVSDRDMVRDFFYNEYAEGNEATNYASIINRQPNFSFEVLTKLRMNNFYTVTQKLPEVKLNIYNQKLGETQFYYQNNMSLTAFDKRYDEYVNLKAENAGRFDTYNKLSYAAKVLKSVFVTPYVATRQTYYSRNQWSATNLWREVYEYGVDLSTKFYRVFNINAEGIGIKGLRHIINPTVGFFSRHQPTISPTNLYQFDNIDALEKANRVPFSIENKLQTKRKSGDGYASVDILRFIVSSDFLFRSKKGGLWSKGDSKFTDVLFDLEIRPFDWIYAQSKVNMNTKDYSLNTATTDLVLKIEDKLKFALSHIYQHSDLGTSSQLTIDTRYDINKEWGIRMYQRFDPYLQKWQEQEYTLYKDMHCWLGEVTCNAKESGFSFWVTMRLKAFPDMPIGLKRSISRPTPGAEEL